MMLSTYGSSNRIISQGLLTQYRQRYDATSQSAPFYELTRIRTKTYSYIGMDEDTASECADAMVAYWKRQIPVFVWNGTSGQWDKVTGTHGHAEYQAAQVALNHTEGGMWEVQVQVNETVTSYWPFPITNMANHFLANIEESDPWGYDDE